MSEKLKALQEVRKKIEGAYHDRDDYPPFKITSFEDRPLYHRYILKIIQELIDSCNSDKPIKTCGDCGGKMTRKTEDVFIEVD